MVAVSRAETTTSSPAVTFAAEIMAATSPRTSLRTNIPPMPVASAPRMPVVLIPSELSRSRVSPRMTFAQRGEVLKLVVARSTIVGVAPLKT